jgi:predicted transposase/invertase (TIGR01784 family)
MARYLDPKNDLTFKRIFGEHPDLLISFLNALMPLEPERRIEHIEYLMPELVPENPLRKNSIVDVRCTDNYGRQFIVEMQMFWSEIFKNRMIFNASKAYVKQIDRGKYYDFLQPVYGLAIINDIFDRKTAEFYHHYQIINLENTEEVIKGLEFVLIELPKFRAEKWTDRKMAVLWLRFLREVEHLSENISPDLLENAMIHEALMLCEEGAFTTEELAAYDRYWDHIRTEKGLASFNRAEGKAEGLIEGRLKGRAEGEIIGFEKGIREKDTALAHIVLNLHRNGFAIEQICHLTALDENTVTGILKQS